MTKAQLHSFSLIFITTLMFTSCAEKKTPPSTTPATGATTQTAPANAATVDGPKLVKTDSTATEERSTVASEFVKKRAATKPFIESPYLPENFIGLVVIHPKQALETPLGKLLSEFDFQNKIPRLGEVVHRAKLNPLDIERATFVLNQPFINAIARQVGLPVGEAAEENVADDRVSLKNSLKEIALAFHNYLSAHQKFPRANGDGAGERTGLSWRVHLLPYWGFNELYEKFNLTEPWDSEQNKALIEQMPDFLKTPGVPDVGKTSFHVFTGENTVFGGEKGMGIQEITDGTSNTILTILAAPDKAEFWTKPGGLEVDLNAPKNSIGAVPTDVILVGLVDGSVIELPADIDDQILALMIQPRDGHAVDIPRKSQSVPTQPALGIPPFILSLNKDVQRDDVLNALLENPSEDSLEGQSFHKNDTLAVWFPDKQTVIGGPIDSVKQMITAKQSGKPNSSPLIDELHLGAELTIAFDLESQLGLLSPVISMNLMTRLLNNIKILAAGIYASGKEGESLVDVIGTTAEPIHATGTATLVGFGLKEGQTIVEKQPLPPNANATDTELLALIKKLATTGTVFAEGNRIQFRIPIPPGFDRLPELLRPTLEKQR